MASTDIVSTDIVSTGIVSTGIKGQIAMPILTFPARYERVVPAHTNGVSHVFPFLLAVALLIGTGVLSVLISGPMH